MKDRLREDSPTVVRLLAVAPLVMDKCMKARGSIGTALAFIDTQQPFPYVHLLSLITDLSLLVRYPAALTRTPALFPHHHPLTTPSPLPHHRPLRASAVGVWSAGAVRTAAAASGAVCEGGACRDRASRLDVSHR